MCSNQLSYCEPKLAGRPRTDDPIVPNEVRRCYGTDPFYSEKMPEQQAACVGPKGDVIGSKERKPTASGNKNQPVAWTLRVRAGATQCADSQSPRYNIL
ncbi:hypothetical protein GCM10028822_30790 [Hymenobacter terrigena]